VTIGRREFIGLMAGAAAGTAVGFPAGRIFDSTLHSGDQFLYPPRGPEQFVLSVCRECSGGCGVRARRIGERVVKLDGNPLHPISGGRLCAKGQAALQVLYHPDRVRVPLRRAGARGSLASFRPSSWDAALNDIAARLQSLRDEQHPESLVLIRGDDRTLGTRIARRFVDAFGSPNDIAFNGGGEAEALALLVTQGVRATPAYDLRAADYVLSLGSEMLETPAAPVYTARAYGDFRQTYPGHRGKFVHVDPRLSITAASADEWIPIRPGSHAAFAFGLATAIVGEGLYDRAFVAERTIGFEDGADGDLRSLIEQYFPLEKAAEQTGVSVNVILRVARELAGAHNGLVLGPHKGPLIGGRLFDHLAAHILNALVGNIDQRGGVLIPEESPLDSWPAVERDSVAASGHRRPRLDGVDASSTIGNDLEQLAQALASGQPYRAEVLFVAGCDPIYASPARQRFASALERVPLVVSFATIPNDTSLYADWILPEPHYLEQWDLHTSPPSVAFPMVSVASPAVPKPLHDTRAMGDVFLTLARRIELQRALPWSDVPTLVRAEIDRLYQVRRGAIMGTDFDQAWVQMMERAGWWSPGYANADELWQRSLEAGGWWDPFYDHGDWSRVFRRKSGRFDFRPDVVRQFAAVSSSLDSSGSLALVLFEPLSVAGGTGAELPFLQAILDPGFDAQWETWGEIHPDTAAVLGIRDGSPIRVASGHEAIVVRARVTERIVQGAIAIPVGLGRLAGGRWAAGVGANPLRLLDRVREPVSLLPDFGSARVLVSEANATDRRAAGRIER